MNSKAIRLIRLIYGIAVSAMAVVSGLLLMAACLQIYRSGGDHIYTPQKVGAAFTPIALPVYITLVLIAGSFLLDFLLPVEKKRKPAQKQYPLLLRIAYKRADLTLCEPAMLENIQKEQNKRRFALLLSAAIWVIGAAVFLPYACNLDNYFYGEQLSRATESIVAAIWWLLPCSLIPTAFSIFAAYYSRASVRREWELVKQAPKAAAPVSLPEKSESWILYARLAILVVALVLIVGGYFAGGTADVLAKAVAICTECVGLG